jgi:hypothetical protein
MPIFDAAGLLGSGKRESPRDGERNVDTELMDVDQLAPDEQLSPELVLVLSPALRAQALARLGPPVWATPPPRATVAQLQPPVRESFGQSFGQLLVARLVQLAVIFATVTAITLAMSLAAHAFR